VETGGVVVMVSNRDLLVVVDELPRDMVVVLPRDIVVLLVVFPTDMVVSPGDTVVVVVVVVLAAMDVVPMPPWTADTVLRAVVQSARDKV
jgi:hypothetical protein